ncbi:MAG: hypothetical protein ABIR48_06295 [Gammaproteobacteria bacterium]
MIYSSPLRALLTVLLTAQHLFGAVALTVFVSLAGCTAAMQQKADKSFLSLKKSLVESVQGSPYKSIAIPVDALATKPDSLKQLLRKLGRLAAQDNRSVEITSVDVDRDYLRQGVASGARESGKPIKITMLDAASRSNTRVVLK